MQFLADQVTRNALLFTYTAGVLGKSGFRQLQDLPGVILAETSFWEVDHEGSVFDLPCLREGDWRLDAVKFRIGPGLSLVFWATAMSHASALF